jgi:hypothetical protein
MTIGEKEERRHCLRWKKVWWRWTEERKRKMWQSRRGQVGIGSLCLVAPGPPHEGDDAALVLSATK